MQARVVAAHKERYTVKTDLNVFSAEVNGSLRYMAIDSFDFPAVGDWVTIAPTDDTHAVILSIEERGSELARQAIGKFGEKQLIATNIDCAFITMSLFQDFSLNRFDRYVSICLSAEIAPVLLLTKSDLVDAEEIDVMVKEINDRHPNIDVVVISINNEDPLKELTELMVPEKTYCFIGSSGVGKSTIINYLLESSELKTSSVSAGNDKGRHTTTHRELLTLKNGSHVIDTPGMREVGVVSDGGVESVFGQISSLSQECKFNNCNHESDKGCAVMSALESGELDQSEYDNYLKLRKEEKHFSQSAHEKRKHEKQFSKIQNVFMRASKNK